MPRDILSGGVGLSQEVPRLHLPGRVRSIYLLRFVPVRIFYARGDSDRRDPRVFGIVHIGAPLAIAFQRTSWQNARLNRDPHLGGWECVRPAISAPQPRPT